MVGPMSQSTHRPADPPPPLAVPARARVVDQLVETLTDAIVSGRFTPGDHLPAERELADSLEVNRTSLRQALSRLEQAGLVESRQGSGTIVLDPVDNPDPHVMARLVHHAGAALMSDLFEVRAGVVAMAARLAAERADENGTTRLRVALDEIRATTTPAALQAAEMAWFSALVDASANRVLITLVRWFARAYGDTAPSFEAAFDDPGTVHDALSTVVHAVEAHDPVEAEAAMTAYAVNGGDRMLAVLRTATAPPGVGGARRTRHGTTVDPAAMPGPR